MARIRVTKRDSRVLHQIAGALPDTVDGFLRAVSTEIVSDIKLSMGTSPPGEEYKRGLKTHIASQPGYPPNPDLGALVNSIRWKRERQGRYIIVDGVIYGAILELGSERVAARPFMKPVFEDWRQRKFMALARTWEWV